MRVRGKYPEVGTPVSPRLDSLPSETSIQGKCYSYENMTGVRKVAFCMAINLSRRPTLFRTTIGCRCRWGTR